MNFCTRCKHYGRGPYAVVEVCLLEETAPKVSPVCGYKSAAKGSQPFRDRFYRTCPDKRKEYSDCPDFDAPTPIKWWQVWRWGE